MGNSGSRVRGGACVGGIQKRCGIKWVQVREIENFLSHLAHSSNSDAS